MSEDQGRAERSALKAASTNGLAINFGAQFVRFGLQFAYQVAIARLLTPADFGIVAMAAPMIAFVGLFADFGLTQATIQRPDITQEQLSLIFWTNVILSACLAVVSFASAPWIAHFYGEPRVGAVVMALGSTFLIGGLYSQHLALLNRRLSFGKLAAVDLISFLVGGTAGLAAAAFGYGYWALVINQVCISVVSLVLAWPLTRWLPSRPRLAEDARAILGSGGNITAFNFVNYFARNLDNVLIGKYIGSAGLGLYDRAYKLLLLPLGQITGPIAKVAIPLLSKLRGDAHAYRRAYMRLLEAVCLLTYPGVVFAMVASDLLIRTVLGPKWAEVAPIFRVLAIGAFFAPVSNSTGWLFITQDRTREMRNCGAASSALFILSFVIGLRWGPLGVAICYITAGAVQGPAVWWAATRRGPLSFSQLLRGLAPYGLALAITGVSEALLQSVLEPSLLTLLMLGAATYPIFLGSMFITRSGRAALSDVRTQLSEVVMRYMGRRSEVNG